MIALARGDAILCARDGQVLITLPEHVLTFTPELAERWAAGLTEMAQAARQQEKKRHGADRNDG